MGVPGLSSAGMPFASPAALPAASSALGSPDALRAQAARDPKGAVREAARQFEALLMQEMIKSMRQATMKSGLLDNESTAMGTEMLDAQWATQLAGRPGGLTEALVRQLSSGLASATEGSTGNALDGVLPATRGAPVDPLPPSRAGAARVVDDTAAVQRGAPATPAQSQFLRQHDAAARRVEAESGIPAAFMIGQAAHETGWGRSEIRHADGSPAHNLFGIKAGGGWRGPVAEITTTEYIDGEPRKVTAKFRAYASYEESFRDFARLMHTSARYGGVMRDLATDGATVREFAQGLQRAGYATDPAYADKLGRVINTTLRLQRAMS
jgi:peptidoglycan hydrolase FlgJ